MVFAFITNSNYIMAINSASGIKFAAQVKKSENNEESMERKNELEKVSDKQPEKTQSQASYDAHAHHIPDSSLEANTHDRFNLYSKGLIEGEARENLLTGGPVYWEGWGKFFHYNDNPEETKPHTFFINNEYYSQRVLKAEKDKKDDKERLMNIPSKFSFYFSIHKDNLIVLSSRKSKLQKTVDSLNIDLILPIASDDPENGGVKDIGEFDEGSCVQVFTNVPEEGPDPNFKVHYDGQKVNWVFCLDSVSNRSGLMKTLVKIKVLKQKAAGDHFFKDKRAPSIAKILKPRQMKNIERYTGPGADKLKDGFWVLYQDWSQCTLKCGGGVQHQQWLCQPPLKGGKPCQGQSIRKRPCNLNPCPKVHVLGDGNKKNVIEVVKKPIVKSLPWSSRKQRYIQCEIKEQDILYIRRDVPGVEGKPIKYPGRLVMTNRTLSMYEDDSFKNAIFSFNIQDTTLATFAADPCCFFALSLNKKYRICGFESACGTKKEPKFVPEWLRHFNLFQEKCYVDLPKKDWRLAMKEQDEVGDHINVDQDKLNDREFLIRRKMKENQDMELEKKIVTTQETALKAIRKEFKLERLIKNEEKLKAKERLKDLLKLKIKEEKKQNCLEKALKAREEESLKGRDSVLAEKEINRIKDDAKKEVEAERQRLRVKLGEYKKKTGRKQFQIEQQINLIRSKMAQNLLLANKNGNMVICKNSSKDQEAINKYCDSNFVTDYKKNIECKDIENFCPLCCESEFGNMFLNKRDECYNTCDDIINDELKGDWIWTKEGFHQTK